MAKKTKAAADKSDAGSDLLSTARKQYEAAYNRERENIDLAYEDLAFRIGDGQWVDQARKAREAEGRPCVTVNMIPQFIRQVTGDMRLSKPSIKCVPVDDRGDKETAEVVAGIIRYIENRSDADSIYTRAADSQVTAGIGAWRVVNEYGDNTTFNQELRVASVDDPVAVLFDPDAKLPTREDAKFCFVLVDMTREAFKERWPDQSPSDWGDLPSTAAWDTWLGDDMVRVAEYWCKKPSKRLLALLPDGSVDDLTDDDGAKRAELEAAGARIEERESLKVYRSTISCGAVLDEPEEWPGRYIPIVACVGEETRIGRKVVRSGLLRDSKDAQRLYNYYCSAHAETVALQPKAPFIGTEENFKRFKGQWTRANSENRAYLTFDVDPNNPGFIPQRVAPPVSSQGISEGMDRARMDMQSTIGIYDAGLGRKSNETSGKAIEARKAESDVGTYVYTANWVQAIKYTGRILLDLIPHVYDTERVIRIVGEDGKEKTVRINEQQIADIAEDGQAVVKALNDVTTGAYDVVMEVGPSFSTRRAEARESMTAFLQSAGPAGQVFLDLIAKNQDWPMADEIGERLELLLPAPIQAKIKEKKGEPVAPPQPDPAQQAEMAKLANETKKSELEVASKELDVIAKRMDIEQKAMQPVQPPQGAQEPAQAAPQAASDEQILEALQGIGRALAANVAADQRQQQEIDGIKQLMAELAQMIGIAPPNSGGPQPPM